MKSPRRFGLSVTVLSLAAAISIVACGKGSDTGSGPSPVNVESNQPVASAPAPAPPAKPVVGNSGPGTGICAGKNSTYSDDKTLQVCELATTFTKLDSRVQKVPENGGSWTVTLGVISATPGYFIDATFSGTSNNGGAIGPDGHNQGNGPYHHKAFPAGESRVDITLTRGPGCGGEQEDIDAKNAGGAQISAFSVVFTWPANCATCSDKLTMTHNESSDAAKVTTTVTIALPNGKVNYTITWGDGTTETHNAAGSFNHSYSTPGTYTVNIKYDKCDPTYTVTVPPVDHKASCEDIKTSFTEVPCPEAASVATTVCKAFQGSYSAGSASVDFGDSSSVWSAPSSPFTKSHGYAQTPAEQSFTATMNVSYNGLTCPKSVTVKIPPKQDSCSNYTPPTFDGKLALTNQTATQVTVTSGTVSPVGGTFNPALPSVQQLPVPPATKTFETTYTKSYGPEALNCKASHEYSIPIPQQEEHRECRLTLRKEVDKSSARDGDILKYTLTVSNEGDADCTGGGVKVDDDIPANIDFVTSSGTVGQCIWQGPVHWNCGTVHPGASIALWWKGKVDNPTGNCNDFTINNKASAWSHEKGTIYSEQVSTDVDITCGPTCPPSQTTSNVNWTKLLESKYGSNPNCGDFGLTTLSKKEFGGGVNNWSTDRDASIVIVKDGKCAAEGPDYFAKKASPNDSSKWIRAGLNVSFTCNGQTKNLSHVEMCGCPVGAASSSRLFDPYEVPDPIN